MSSHEKTPLAPPVRHDEDDDLDDLLDEFDEQILSKPPGAQSSQGDTGNNTAKGAPTDINDLIKDLDIEDPEAKSQFEQLIKQFQESHVGEDDKSSENDGNITQPADFDNVMRDTMERLKKSGASVDEQLKSDRAGANPEDMLTQLLAGLGGAGDGDGDVDMTKLLSDMLEQLSSKEVLQEPIRDLNSKFPAYLQENKDTLAADEHARYTKQYEITKDILAVFDSSTYDDENTEHRDEVNVLLESLQELGNPPTELVGDENDFPGFGGGAGAGSGAGGAAGLDFDSKDLPKDFEKELEEGCKQT